MFFSLDLSLFGLRHILEDEAQNGPRPMPYGIAKAPGSLPSVALTKHLDLPAYIVRHPFEFKGLQCLPQRQIRCLDQQW